MTQNIYDDPDFFAGYSQLARSKKGLDGAPEWDALRALLPNLQGLNVLDLGCGYGWFSRWATQQGAQQVLALDVSERMLAKARASEPTQGITYLRADLEHLSLDTERFDLAYSALAFHYVEHLPRLFDTLFAALKPGERLVFSIEHPIYMASRHADWLTLPDGSRYWPVSHYQNEGLRQTDWLAPGVVKYHRTQGNLLNALIRAGFSLQHIEDWGPSPEQLAAQPALNDEMHRPMMLLVSANK